MPKCAVRPLLGALTLAAASAVGGVAAPQSAPVATPPSVFASDAPLELTIRTDLRAIEALYDLGPLNPDHRERARQYYADFFRLIDDPRRVRREMLASCQ